MKRNGHIYFFLSFFFFRGGGGWGGGCPTDCATWPSLISQLKHNVVTSNQNRLRSQDMF